MTLYMPVCDMLEVLLSAALSSSSFPVCTTVLDMWQRTPVSPPPEYLFLPFSSGQESIARTFFLEASKFTGGGADYINRGNILRSWPGQQASIASYEVTPTIVEDGVPLHKFIVTEPPPIPDPEFHPQA